MSEIVRFGITFPLELSNEFDKLIKKLSYKNNSQTIHNSVRSLISEYKELEEERGMKAGIITIFYNHKLKG